MPTSRLATPRDPNAKTPRYARATREAPQRAKAERLRAESGESHGLPDDVIGIRTFAVLMSALTRRSSRRMTGTSDPQKCGNGGEVSSQRRDLPGTDAYTSAGGPPRIDSERASRTIPTTCRRLNRSSVEAGDKELAELRSGWPECPGRFVHDHGTLPRYSRPWFRSSPARSLMSSFCEVPSFEQGHAHRAVKYRAHSMGKGCRVAGLSRQRDLGRHHVARERKIAGRRCGHCFPDRPHSIQGLPRIRREKLHRFGASVRKSGHGSRR